MPLTADISLRVKLNQSGSHDFGGPSFPALMSLAAAMTSGVAAGMVDMAWIDERTLAASSNDDIDLAGGLTDAFGVAATFAKVNGIFVINKPRNATEAANLSTLSLGLGTNPFVGHLAGTTPAIRAIGPGGFIALWNPDLAGLGSVTGGSNDILRVTFGAGGTGKYQIAILGRSA